VATTADGGTPEGVPFDIGACLPRLVDGTAKAVRGLGRRGAVVAVSGGIDSSVVAALCVRALGAENVLCLRLPERDVGSGSSDLGLELARALGAPTVEEPITDALAALGCYERRDEAIRKVFPEYEPNWRHKLVRSRPSGGIIVFSLVVERPDGTEEQRRMPPEAYRELLAATNMKQRIRKLLEYTWADRLSYAVVGTPNLLEYDQGFFVKGGDGLADVKPIAGLYRRGRGRAPRCAGGSRGGRGRCARQASGRGGSRPCCSAARPGARSGGAAAPLHGAARRAHGSEAGQGPRGPATDQQREDRQASPCKRLTSVCFNRPPRCRR
jgi:NH3-dependent NAD+ synthetase